MQSTPKARIKRRWIVLLAATATLVTAGYFALDHLADNLRTYADLPYHILVLEPAEESDPYAASYRTITDVNVVTETLPANIVLLIHGLDEPGNIFNDLAPELRNAGHTVLLFEYPNDQRIERSGTQLIRALVGIKSAGATDIDIVCHSMGGLVARDALTRPADESTTIEALPTTHHLILVGTPNRGSPWAKLRAVSEVREQIARLFMDNPPERDSGLAYLADGEGQAGKDLEPGSDYLNELNSRSNPANVAITTIIGELGPADNQTAADMLNTETLARIIGKELANNLAKDLASAMGELGDGVVPVTSAVLPGVGDIVRLTTNHRSMLKVSQIEHKARRLAGSPRKIAPAISPILDRLSPAPGETENKNQQKNN